MFVGDFNSKLEAFGCGFNSKLEAFGCAKKNSSGPMLKNLTYLNNDEHTYLDRAKGSTDILDMAFISPNLTKHDIQFLTGDDWGSDHLPIEISIDAQLHRNAHTNPVRHNAGIRLTDYYPPPLGITPGPLFFRQNPCPGDSFSVQDSAPRVKKTK